MVGDYVRLVGTQWEDVCHCNPDLTDAGATKDAMVRWNDGTFGRGVSYCPQPGGTCDIGRGWTEMHPVDYMAKLLPPASHNDALEVIAMAGEGEITRSIRLPPKPFASAHVVYRKIDSGFTLLKPGDLADETVTVTSTGIDVHIKLNARSGITPGFPKYFAGFYVAWGEGSATAQPAPLRRTTVPDVREMGRSQAVGAITAAGLVPHLQGSQAQAVGAWVHSQAPAGGTIVNSGSAVTLQMRTGPIP
jgi:PASTA domain